MMKGTAGLTALIAAVAVAGCTAPGPSSSQSPAISSPTTTAASPTTTAASPTPTASPTPEAPAQGFFTATGPMSVPRMGHTATLLLDGRVLIAGGAGPGESPYASAEIFDRKTRTFTLTGSMSVARWNHTATLLADGRVLVAGGSDNQEPVASAEIYDPATGKFTASGSLGAARYSHTATLLNSGRVLITGGAALTNVTATSEIYDPANGTFAPTGRMRSERMDHVATLLSNGRVLITGGKAFEGGAVVEPLPTAPPANHTRKAEIYNPATGKFSDTGTMASERARHTATLLQNGRVLIAGPEDVTEMGEGATVVAEIYDSATGRFTRTADMDKARYGVGAALLPDGRVLVVGSVAGEGMLPSVYDPASRKWLAVVGTTAGRSDETVTLLADGTVLVAGGQSEGLAILASAEIYWPEIAVLP